MKISHTIAVAMFAVGGALAALPAAAQDAEIIDGATAWKDEEPVNVDGAAIAEGAPTAQSEGTRVYGWSSRGTARGGSCGMYHYWDGARCADARVDPPVIDY